MLKLIDDSPFYTYKTGNPFFKASKSMSSSKVNDQPAVVDLKTNDNGQGKVY